MCGSGPLPAAAALVIGVGLMQRGCAAKPSDPESLQRVSASRRIQKWPVYVLYATIGRRVPCATLAPLALMSARLVTQSLEIALNECSPAVGRNGRNGGRTAIDGASCDWDLKEDWDLEQADLRLPSQCWMRVPLTTSPSPTRMEVNVDGNSNETWCACESPAGVHVRVVRVHVHVGVACTCTWCRCGMCKHV